MKFKIMFSVTLAIAMIAVGLSFSTGTASAVSGTVKVVALGDSYTSGNGALDYSGGDCYRSANAYVYQYAGLVRDTGMTVEARNAACGGATASSIGDQINSNRSLVGEADLIFLTVGGNDGDFGDVVVKCLAVVTRFINHCSSHLTYVEKRLDTINDGIRTAIQRLVDSSGHAEIVLVGYPYLIGDGCFDDGDLVRDLQKKQDELTAKMIATVDSANSTRRIRYESMLAPFNGGEVCGNGPSLIRGTFDTFDRNEWWHPNVEGHAVIASELFDLGLHVPVGPPTTIPTPTNVAGQSYTGLPFACGVDVPFASTYDSFNYGGTIFQHGLSLDMPIAYGTKVVAPESGTVYVRSEPAGYGTYIDLWGDSGTIHRMAHLKGAAVSSGTRVSRASTIGYVGTTGASTGPHLHYEQRTSISQKSINLGGPSLRWGAKQDSSGFRITTHKLVSGNCEASAPPNVDDVIYRSSGKIAYSKSNRRTEATNGTVAFTSFVPTSASSCNFDGGTADEYIAHDSKTGAIMLADPKGVPNAQFYWRQIGTASAAVKLVCGDWDNDGLDDVLIYTKGNNLYFGRSNGKSIGPWQIIMRNSGEPTYWDMCDMNGDGRDELVSYHADVKQFYAGHRTGAAGMGRQPIFGRVGGIGGIACGNFLAGGFDELIAWNNGHNGRYLLGWLDTPSYTTAHLRGLSPTGLSKPFNGEVVAGDIDGDGLDEFIVNEQRGINNHSIMVGDVNSTQSLSWHAFRNNVVASFIAVGDYVR